MSFPLYTNWRYIKGGWPGGWRPGCSLPLPSYLPPVLAYKNGLLFCKHRLTSLCISGSSSCTLSLTVFFLFIFYCACVRVTRKVQLYWYVFKKLDLITVSFVLKWKRESLCFDGRKLSSRFLRTQYHAWQPSYLVLSNYLTPSRFNHHQVQCYDPPLVWKEYF